jgi:hypothetical protein
MIKQKAINFCFLFQKEKRGEDKNVKEFLKKQFKKLLFGNFLFYKKYLKEEKNQSPKDFNLYFSFLNFRDFKFEKDVFLVFFWKIQKSE